MRSKTSLSIVYLVFLLILISCEKSDKSDIPSEDMTEVRKDFLNPPDHTRPGCYWYWINDNISKEGITGDLEAMARVGIGRAYIGHIYNYRPQSGNTSLNTPLGDVKFKTEEWWEALKWAVSEADRCGIEIGFFNSPGWSQSGGPWIKPHQSMRYLAYSETQVRGGQKINQIMPVPEIKTYPNAGGSRPVQTGPKFTEEDFQDVRLIAFKQPDQGLNDLANSLISYDSGEIENIGNIFDEDIESSCIFPAGKNLVINIILNDEALSGEIQSLKLQSPDSGYILQCSVETSDNGKEYRQIADYSEQRGHQGPRKTDPVYIPFTPTIAKYLRLVFNVSKQMQVTGLSLSGRAVLGGYVRKQLGETSPSTNPPWDAYQWGDQVEPADGSTVLSGVVIDLSDKMEHDGRLVWDVPEGDWIILRMGMVPIGTQNAPSSPESRGLEVDKMNKHHIDSLFDGMVGEFLRRTPANQRKALKYVIADSYETGPQNWTDDFCERFENRFGYSPERFMPVLTGRVVDNPDISDRFLWDIRRLIVESVANEYVGGLRDICNQNGLTLWLENYGHWGYPSEFLLYGSQTNQVGGEFWIGSVRNNIECRAAVSSAHIYGKKSVYAESFTSGQNFQDSPATLKKWCDWVYGVGVNHLILHVYIHQPYERKPGIIQWFGTDFNRHNTWFYQSKDFIDYTRRSSVLLKAGIPVVDVAYYVGEDGPMMQGPQDPRLPDGYNFDFINSDVLINRTDVIDGRIVVKDGPEYSLLVLPQQKKMRPDVARAIQKLVREGASIIGPKPLRSPSLEGYPYCDEEVARIGEEVWGDIDGINQTAGNYGKGNIYNGLLLSEVLYSLGVEKDVIINSEEDIRCAAAGSGHLGIGGNGGIVFNHRKGKDKEIYFLANTSDRAVDFTVSLRGAGLKPYLWNAVEGSIKDAGFTRERGRTIIPLQLDASESIFIVFDGKVSSQENVSVVSNVREFRTIAKLDSSWIVKFDDPDIKDDTTFDKLSDWVENDNPAIKNFSGSAEYLTSFNLQDKDTVNPIILDMGKVGVIATVYLNGSEAGTVWAPPWKIDISDCIVEGNNNLKVRVSNTWHNRVFADSGLPLAERKTYISQNYNFGPDAKLHESGLIGPVRILQEVK